MRAHGSTTQLPALSSSQKLHVHEEKVTLTDVAAWAASGRLLESFTVGTAVVVASVGRIGAEGRPDIELPQHEGSMGCVARALFEKITAIQEGREQYERWSLVCE
jgi:branched-chain amino acid aminotransferase